MTVFRRPATSTGRQESQLMIRPNGVLWSSTTPLTWANGMPLLVVPQAYLSAKSLGLARMQLQHSVSYWKWHSLVMNLKKKKIWIVTTFVYICSVALNFWWNAFCLQGALCQVCGDHRFPLPVVARVIFKFEHKAEFSRISVSLRTYMVINRPNTALTAHVSFVCRANSTDVCSAACYNDRFLLK